MSVERTIGRYEVLRELGRGGMAVVYLARQTDLGRLVALKELSKLGATDPSFAHRFVRESRLGGSLAHPNIVVVHEFFEHGGTPYIAMEHVPGGSLRPQMGTLTPPQIAGVLEGVLAGLAHAEGAGVVHRDLKPENLMVTDEGRIKVADFGIARASGGAETAFMTATGTAVGTPAYMAPEQAMGEESGPWTDLYAVGVLAYEMLADRLPFPPQGETPMAILMRKVNEAPPHLRTLQPELDPALAEWVMALLERRPEDRPTGAEHAWQEAEDILIETLGPRWRRGARLAEPGTETAHRPLTPAPFESTHAATPEPGPTAESEFTTFAPGRGDRAEAPPAPTQPTEAEAPTQTRAPATRTAEVGAAEEPSAPPRPEPRRPLPPSGRPGRRPLVIGIAALLLAAGAGALVLAGGGGNGDEAEPVSVGAPEELPAPGGRPAAIATDGEDVYVATSAGVARYDAADPGEPLRARLPGTPGGIAAGEEGVWVASNEGVYPLDESLRKDQFQDRLAEVGRRAGYIAVGEGSLWAASEDASGRVYRLDPATGERTGAVELDEWPGGLAVGGGAVWVTVGKSRVARIDPDALEITAVGTVKGFPGPIGIGDERVWIGATGEDLAVPLDAGTAEPAGEPVPTGLTPLAIAVGGGTIWTANHHGGDGTIVRIDAETGEVLDGPVQVGGNPYGAVYVGDALWVIDRAGARVLRLAR